MKLRTILAASTALSLVAAAPGASASELYLSVFGGMNLLSDTDGQYVSPTFSSSSSVIAPWSSDADTGFVVGGAVGTSLDKWANGLRVEAEVSFRRNDLGGTYSTSGTIDGNLSTFAVMANAWYDFDIGAKVRPYVGGGIGWARMDGDVVLFTDSSAMEQTDSGFAWQIGLGGRYAVGDGVAVGLGYRYFSGPEFASFGAADSSRLDNDSHAVQLELNIDIK
jgi:opacity protein-like surface antigen